MYPTQWRSITSHSLPWGSCHPLPFFVSQGDTEGKNNTYNYQADKIKCQCKYEGFPPHIYVLFFMEWWMPKTSILKIHLLWIMINTNEMHVSPVVGNFGGNSHLTVYYLEIMGKTKLWLNPLNHLAFFLNICFYYLTFLNYLLLTRVSFYVDINHLEILWTDTYTVHHCFEF